MARNRSFEAVWLIFCTPFRVSLLLRHISHEQARESCSPLRFVFGGCSNFVSVCWLSLNSPATSGHFESPSRSAAGFKSVGAALTDRPISGGDAREIGL